MKQRIYSFFPQQGSIATKTKKGFMCVEVLENRTFTNEREQKKIDKEYTR